jgi:hypothetical protein
LGRDVAPPCLAGQPTQISPAKRAELDAERLLGFVPAIPNSTLRTGAPPKEVAGPPLKPTVKELIDLHVLWTTAAAPADVLEYLKDHMTAELLNSGSARGGQALMFVPVGATPPGLGNRQLLLTVVPAGLGSVVRADAQVIWLPERPAREYAPYNTRSVTVTRIAEETRSTTATKGSVVRRFVDAFNEEPMAATGTRHCPAVLTTYRIEFTPKMRGAHHVVGVIGACNTIAVTVDGQSAPALQDARRLVTLASVVTATR